MIKIVVVGGGIAGCATAAAAARAGAEVTLLERAELLGGWALVAGRMDHNLLTLREELKLMGGYDIFQVIDNCTLHGNVRFPWPKPTGATKTLYDTVKLEPELKNHLEGLGVDVRLQSRAKDVEMDGRRITTVVLDSGARIQGDAFVDASGGTGGLKNCQKYGNGCAMCLQRCPAFGDRVSIVAKAGIKELLGKRSDGTIGPLVSAYSLVKESLAPEVAEKLDREGVIWLPVPPELVSYKRGQSIVASVNIDDGFAENVVLADIGGGRAKRIAAGYTPLPELRKVPGLERTVYADPYAGTIGNGIRFMAISPRTDALDVPGVENLFIAGEKLGIAGIGEVIGSGVISGHNAVRKAAGMASLVLPETTMLGGYISYVNKVWDTEEGLRTRVQIFRGPYFHEALQAGITIQNKDIKRSRMEQSGLINVFSRTIA